MYHLALEINEDGQYLFPVTVRSPEEETQPEMYFYLNKRELRDRLRTWILPFFDLGGGTAVSVH
jgi:hypothetical protein